MGGICTIFDSRSANCLQSLSLPRSLDIYFSISPLLPSNIPYSGSCAQLEYGHGKHGDLVCLKSGFLLDSNSLSSRGDDFVFCERLMIPLPSGGTRMDEHKDEIRVSSWDTKWQGLLCVDAVGIEADTINIWNERDRIHDCDSFWCCISVFLLAEC